MASGPGSDWHMAMASRICSLVSQPRSATSSRSICPTSATGPPNPNNPSRRKYKSSSLSWPRFTAVSICELDGVIVCPEVHEEQARLLIKHVTVQGCDLDPVCAQRFDYRID